MSDPDCPNGSFDCFCFISSSRSSRNTTHFVVGCMTASSPLPSHQACAVKLPCMTGSKVCICTHQSASDFTSHLQSAVQKESCVFFSSLSHSSSNFLCHMSSALMLCVSVRCTSVRAPSNTIMHFNTTMIIIRNCHSQVSVLLQRRSVWLSIHSLHENKNIIS